MRLASLVLSAVGTLAALPLAAGTYIRQPHDLEPFRLFRRTGGDSNRPEVTVSPDKNTGAGAAVFFAQAKSDGSVDILGDALSAERTAQIKKFFPVFGFTGAEDSTVKIPGEEGDPASLLIFTGVGNEMNKNTTRGAAAFGVRAAYGVTTKVAIMVPKTHDDVIASAADGAVSGTYVWNKYKSNAPPRVDCIIIVSDCDPAKIVHDATVSHYVNWARDLVNEPANVLNPETFAQLASDIATPAGIAVEIWDEKRLAAERLDAILAVGAGSENKPRLVKLSYTPGGGKRNNRRHVVLVGGGITFDSGGLSAKSTGEMSNQRGDMAGAAAVFKTILAAHELKVNTRITAWLPLAENMPGGGGMRIGDIVRTYANKTVEIVDTDNESRLLMVDAIAFAMQEEHDILVDISTYSSSGDQNTHAEYNGDNFRCEPDMDCAYSPVGKRDAADADGNSAADTTNSGTPLAFLYRFPGMSSSWGRYAKRDNYNPPKLVHINLGAMGWNPGRPYADQPSMGTGAGVKTLLAVAEQYAL